LISIRTPGLVQSQVLTVVWTTYCCLRLPCCCYCYWRMVYRSGVGDSSRCADGPRIGSSASICCPHHCQKVVHRCQFSFLSSVYL